MGHNSSADQAWRNRELAVRHHNSIDRNDWSPPHSTMMATRGSRQEPHRTSNRASQQLTRHRCPSRHIRQARAWPTAPHAKKQARVLPHKKYGPTRPCATTTRSASRWDNAIVASRGADGAGRQHGGEDRKTSEQHKTYTSRHSGAHGCSEPSCLGGVAGWSRPRGTRHTGRDVAAEPTGRDQGRVNVATPDRLPDLDVRGRRDRRRDRRPQRRRGD